MRILILYIVVFNIMFILDISEMYSRDSDIVFLENTLLYSHNKDYVDICNLISEKYIMLSIEQSLIYINLALKKAIQIKYYDGAMIAMKNMTKIMQYYGYTETAKFSIELIEMNCKYYCTTNTISIIMLAKATIYYYDSKIKKCIDQINKTIDYSEANREFRSLAFCYNVIGNQYSMIWGLYNRAIQYFDEAISILKNNQSDYYHKRYSLDYYNKSIEELLAEIYTNKAFALYYSKKPKEAFDLLARALYIQTNIKDYFGQANSYKMYGDFYLQQKKYNYAIMNYNISLIICQEFDINVLKGDLYTRIGHCNYCMNNNPLEELYYSMSAYQARVKTGISEKITSSLLNISNCYFLLKDYNKSLEYAKNGLSKALSIKQIAYIQKAYKIITESYYNIKDYSNSALYYDKYYNSSIQLNNEIGFRKISGYQYELEKEKKNQEINQLKLHNQDYLIYLMTGIVIVIFIILLLLVYLYYTKKKENNRIQKQKNDLENLLERLQESDEKLNEGLIEKDGLIKEIHHRVKNNLQIIMSLLELKKDITQEEATKVILLESQTRIKAISIIHEILYHSDNFAYINFSEYLEYLVNYLLEAFNSYNKISYIPKIENIEISINQALPCGLIFNELFTNSIKHAFPNDMKGEIRVELDSIDNNIQLTVSDNGIGIPDNISFDNSLGLELIKRLTKQLDGTFEFFNAQGAVFKIKFSK